MKEYKNSHGFTVGKVEYIEELSANLVTMCHEKTDLPLYFIDRSDSNRSFAIGFRTPPTDDTGIFHILEHSVLSGSESFPVKDPFAELLKSSASTYLNALTYPDRTVYPVSSKNSKAFLDLVRVYLDAVFFPLALTNKNIFLQEGHRIEFDEDGDPVYNGVVFNEMQGALASIDDYADYHTDRLLFRGGTYGYDSGGTPEGILSLKYEDFIAAHKKYYHPTNAYIFLDGDIELEKTLSLIDSYLCRFNKGDVHTHIEIGEKPDTTSAVGAHPDVPKGKCDIHLGRRIFDASERERLFALSLVEDVLCDSNSAPLKKRMLGSGLCDNFHLYVSASTKFPTLRTIFRGVPTGREEEVIALYRSTLSDIISEGLEPSDLRASLGSFEFRARESDYGSFPKGMVLHSSLSEALIQGEDPAAALRYNELFRRASDRIGSSYYTDVLAEALDAPEEIRFTIYKSDTEQPAELRPTNLSPKELDEIKAECKALAAWQASPNSPEAEATIPILSVEDLDLEIERTPDVFSTRGGISVLSHPIDTSGLCYVEMYFDCSDIPADRISALSILSTIYSDLDGERYTSFELSKQVKMHLGSLYTTVTAAKRGDETRLYFVVKFSSTDAERMSAIELFSEYVLGANFRTRGAVERKLAQMATGSTALLLENAHRFAVNRAAARYDRLDAIKERISGLDFLADIKKYAEDKEKQQGLPEIFEEMRRSFFTKKRLTLCITGEYDEGFVTALLEKIPEGDVIPAASEIQTYTKKNEYIAISSPVSFTAMMSNFKTCTEEQYHGAMAIVSTVMSLELLWDRIRIKGGAYDTGFIVRANSGGIGYYSYRDPNPTASIDVFRNGGDMLRDFAKECDDLDGYIVGTIGATDTVSTPRADGALANTHYLAGITYEDRLRHRRETIQTSRDDLMRIASLLDRTRDDATFCICADREKLVECGASPEEIIEI